MAKYTPIESELPLTMNQLNKMSTFTISATALDNNNTRVDATIPEVLGEFHGQEFSSKEAAQEAVETIESEADLQRFPGLELEVIG